MVLILALRSTSFDGTRPAQIFKLNQYLGAHPLPKAQRLASGILGTPSAQAQHVAGKPRSVSSAKVGDFSINLIAIQPFGDNSKDGFLVCPIGIMMQSCV